MIHINALIPSLIYLRLSFLFHYLSRPDSVPHFRPLHVFLQTWRLGFVDSDSKNSLSEIYFNIAYQFFFNFFYFF